MLKPISNFLKAANVLCMAALLLTVLLVIIDAKLKLGATWASELSTFLLGWTVMLGGSLAYAQKAHLGLDILVSKFDNDTQAATKTTGHIIILAFACLVMIYGGARITFQRYEMEQLLPGLGISKAWYYLCLPLAGTLIGLIATAHIFNNSSSKN